jgi:hypothetical protein
MLTRNVQRTLPIPHEPGNTMTLRQLSWLQLVKAEEARSNAVLENLKVMGGDLLRDLQTINRDQVEADATREASDDPQAKYDRGTVLRAGIVDWDGPNYTEPLDPTLPEGARKKIPVTGEMIDSLDTATALWATREIIGLGRPPTEQEQEDSFFGSPNTSRGPVALPMSGSSA